MAFNSMRDSMMANDNTIKPRYVHSPIAIEHNGIHAAIQENGKIKLSGRPDNEGEYDEMEIPASLVFKLARLLKDTRHTVYDAPVNHPSKDGVVTNTRSSFNKQESES